MKVCKQLFRGWRTAAAVAGAVFAGIAQADEPTRMLFLGNSITLHAPNASIGWSGNWGMAASAEVNDYVHVMATNVFERTGVAPVLRVRNIADFERSIYTYDLASDENVTADVAFDPDIVVIAVGENASTPSTEVEKATFQAQIKALAAMFSDTTEATNIVIRSPFWQNNTQASLMKAAADELGVRYVDAGPLGNVAANKATGLFEHAGVANHPGDTGMQAIADLILGAIYPEEEEEEEETPESPDVTEIGSYTAADGAGTNITSLTAFAGGNAKRGISTGEFVHTFTSDGYFTSIVADQDIVVQYLIVGGGGGGGGLMSAGGGAGAARVGTVTVKAGSNIKVTVGQGGAGGSGSKGYRGSSGTVTEIWMDGFLVDAAAGGGAGGGWSGNQDALSGASSGGQADGRTKRVAATDGHTGGPASGNVPGGGGGAGTPGAVGTDEQAGAGGDGVICRITGAAVAYAAGGGGGSCIVNGSWGSFAGGVGGSSGVGGAGGVSGAAGSAGAANTGSGGGGGGGWSNGGAGADGVAVFRYAYAHEVSFAERIGSYEAVDDEGETIAAGPCVGGNSIRQLSNDEYVHVFTSDGTFTAPKGDPVEVSYLIVGGGGSGGSLMAGGGGAGAVRVGTFTLQPLEKATVTIGAGGVADNVSKGASGTAGGTSYIAIGTTQIAFAPGGGGGAG